LFDARCNHEVYITIYLKFKRKIHNLDLNVFFIRYDFDSNAYKNGFALRSGVYQPSSADLVSNTLKSLSNIL